MDEPETQSELANLAAEAGPPSGIYCKQCRYHLRGLTAGTCPECGFPFDPDRASTYFRVNQRTRIRLPRIDWIVLILGIAIFLAMATIDPNFGNAYGAIFSFLTFIGLFAFCYILARVHVRRTNLKRRAGMNSESEIPNHKSEIK